METLDAIKPAIAVLTWNNLKCCTDSIKTWETFGITDNAEKLVAINQSNFAYEVAMKERNFFPIPFPTNVGIAIAFRELVFNTKSPYLMFLEHDWKILSDVDAVKQISDSCKLLESGRADAVRLRHRTNYGEPLYTIPIKDHIAETHPHHLMDCPHWEEDPVGKYPDVFWEDQIDTTRFILCKAKNGAFTNNPTIYKTEFLKKHIVPLSGIPGGTLESDIQTWWCEQDFNVARPYEGVFTHAPT